MENESADESMVHHADSCVFRMRARTWSEKRSFLDCSIDLRFARHCANKQGPKEKEVYSRTKTRMPFRKGRPVLLTARDEQDYDQIHCCRDVAGREEAVSARVAATRLLVRLRVLLGDGEEVLPLQREARGGDDSLDGGLLRQVVEEGDGAERRARARDLHALRVALAWLQFLVVLLQIRLGLHDARLEEIHFRDDLVLLAELLVGEQLDTADDVADLLDEVRLGAEEERHAADGAHVHVVEHLAAQRVRQLLEHMVVVFGAALLLVAEVALHVAPHRLGDAVAREELVNALQIAAVLDELRVEPQNQRRHVGREVDEHGKRDEDDHDGHDDLRQGGRRGDARTTLLESEEKDRRKGVLLPIVLAWYVLEGGAWHVVAYCSAGGAHLPILAEGRVVLPDDVDVSSCREAHQRPVGRAKIAAAAKGARTQQAANETSRSSNKW
eukprot:6191645-Pleurochrysis_carterae.AAC.1